MSERFTYLPWTRRADVSGASVVVRAAGQDIDVPVNRFGAGDVVGIAPDQILRREPPPGSAGFQPNLFPFIELRAADLPWRLSPATPNSLGRLRPWLALVVVPVESGSPLVRIPNAPLPAIELTADALPNMRDIDLWAHVQVPVDAQSTLEQLLATDRVLARILSPRALKPRTRYAACLVPTYESGRRAGLGLDIGDPHSLTPAWDQAAVTLPVLDHWFFSTAEAGDFETLARRLVPRDLSANARPWPLDVAAVAGDAEEHVVPFDTALVPWGWSDAWRGEARDVARERLRAWLARVDDASADVPAIGPPAYGEMAAAKKVSQSHWLGELNLDPRWRAAAALGAEAVRRNQEELVADAWRQMGDMRRANRERDVAALATFVTARLVVKHVQPLAAEAVLTMTAPMLARRKAGTATTMHVVGASALPTAVLAPAFRRLGMMKARGGAPALSTFVARMSVRVPTQGALPPTPATLMTVTRARTVLATFPRQPRPPRVLPATRKTLAIRAGVARLTQRTVRWVNVSRQRSFAIAETSGSVTRDLVAFRAAARRVASRLDLGDVGREVRATSPLVGALDVPWPLAEALTEMDARYLMAGIDMPPDTAGLLQINGTFVTAALVGANHELIRELTWRGARVDRRATPLRRFFDRRGSGGAGQPDVGPVATWPLPSTLEANFALTGRAVIVLRGELVSRFPHASIHAARAIRQGTMRKPGTDVRLPLFRGAITADSMFVGFDLTPNEMRSGSQVEGWYIVITEQPAAPRFGLDEQRTTSFATWNDLAWNDVTVANGYLSGASQPAPANQGTLRWARNAAHIAGITFQRLVAIAIHAADMLPRESS
jgi:hypothetical protein